MGVVKYSGPVASFHCPTEAEIRSLKVHFSPKQLGSGDPSPENIREIVGWDGVEVYNYTKTDVNTDIIPSEYKKVEYLESTGTQYIDTGVITGNAVEVEAVAVNTFGLVANSGRHYGGTLFGGRVSSTNSNYSFVTGELYDYVGNGSNFKEITRNANTDKIYITYSNESISYVCENYEYSSNLNVQISNPKSIYIFAMNQNDKVGSYGTFKIFSLKISDNASFVRNFIPCVRKSDNKSGMYDTVSGQFFTNQGTGEFICGPDVGQTTSYEFGVLGKNKFNWDVEESQSTPVSSDAGTARTFTLNTYVVGMSINNYYRQNYANWVLNPSVSNGVISFSSNAASGYGIAFPLKLAAGQTYFLSGTGDGTVGATYYNEDGELISYQNGRLNKTITIPDNTITTLIGFYASASNTEFSFSNIQLELGDSATTYEPYNSNKTVYGGWVDLISGEVCEEYGSVTMDGTTAGGYYSTSKKFWGKSGVSGTNAYYARFREPAPIIDDAARWLCNIALTYNWGNGTEAKNVENIKFLQLYASTTTSNEPRLAFPIDSEINTLEKANQFLADMYAAGTPVTYSYPLATPITYNLAPTSLQTFLAQNNVWSNADYVEVEYDLHETQTILERKQFIMANQPHIESASGAIASFTTDMAAALKGCKVHFIPVQSGTGDPSPDNVRPISGWAEIEAYRTGKNICDINHPLFTAVDQNSLNSWNSYVNNGAVINGGKIGVITGSGLTFSAKTGYNYVISFIPGGESANYNIRAVNLGSDNIWSDATNLTFDTTTSGQRKCLSFIFPSGYTHVFFAGFSANKHGSWESEIQLEFSSIATNYEPYNGTTLPIDWTDEAGTVYGGYVNLVKGEVVAEYIQRIYDGSSDESWALSGNDTYVCNQIDARNDIRNIRPICDKFYMETTYGTNYRIRPVGNKIYANTVAEWREWLAQNPIQVVYELAEPIHYPITPQTLKTLRGTNNIWSNAGDVSVAYWKH